MEPKNRKEMDWKGPGWYTWDVQRKRWVYIDPLDWRYSVGQAWISQNYYDRLPKEGNSH